MDNQAAVNVMVLAYLEAADFTDNNDGASLEFSNAFKASARVDCEKLLRFVHNLGGFIITKQTCVQLGHDLWLTRNRHGAGFWDRPDIYEDKADKLTEFAVSLGECYAEFTEN